MGGQAPIIGATVSIYATGTSYGTGQFLQEATQQGTSAHQDTDSNGFFQFAGGYDCPAGQFAYVVSANGNTGANTANPAAVLVAALGRCEDLYNYSGGNYTGYKGSAISLNELTTVAAAYALGNFASVSGTGAAVTVGIGADATNNAAQIGGVSTGCVAGIGTCTTTAAAGLAHAFKNAANLVNVFTLPAVANATVPGNSAAIVPQALLNSIANSLVSCVNSDGLADSDCGTLFGYVGGSPTNAFQAMVNLAANPTMSGSATAVQNYYALATAQTSVYSPSLVSSVGLNDLSVAINYPAGLGAVTGTQGLTYPVSGALDINDIYYVGNQSVSGGAVPVNLLAFSSNGTLLGATPNGATMKFAMGLSVDATGYGYFGNGSGSGTNALGVFATGGGSVGSLTTGGSLGQFSIKTVNSGNSAKIYGTAVDQHNNVWAFGTATSGDSSLYMSAAGGGSFTGLGAFTAASFQSYPGLAIDPDQNVWITVGNNTGTVVGVQQNTGTAASPSYAAASILTTTNPGNPGIGIAFTGSSAPFTPYISSYSSGTPTPSPGITPYTTSYSGAEVATVAAGTLTNASTKISGSYFNEADGAGNIWIADVNSHSVIQFNPGAGTAYRLEPCSYQSSTGGCFTGTATQSSLFTTGKPFTVSIDSTGSIWVTAPAGGNVVQIIGAAAPTWPLLSLGLSSQKP